MTTFQPDKSLQRNGLHPSADLYVILAAGPVENIANVSEVVATVKSGRLYNHESTAE